MFDPDTVLSGHARRFPGPPVSDPPVAETHEVSQEDHLRGRLRRFHLRVFRERGRYSTGSCRRFVELAQG